MLKSVNFKVLDILRASCVPGLASGAWVDWNLQTGTILQHFMRNLL